MIEDRGTRSDSLDGRDVPAVDLSYRYQAGADWFTVNQHSAGATVASVTTYFSSHQPETFAQHFGESLYRRNRDTYVSTIHREGCRDLNPILRRDCRGHVSSSPRRPPA